MVTSLVARARQSRLLGQLVRYVVAGFLVTALGAGAYRLAPLLARTRVWQVLDGLIAVVMVGVAALVLG